MAARTIGRCGPSCPCDNHRVLHTDLHLLARVALGIGVGFVFGYERQLRGSPAGNRTFALIGGTAAGVTAVAGTTSPQALAGILLPKVHGPEDVYRLDSLLTCLEVEVDQPLGSTVVYPILETAQIP